MRPLPKDNSGTERQPPVWQDPDLTLGNTLIRQVRKYELITPLFGGGVEAGVNDPTMLIRGTSVRGQLRFWWRATRGGEFDGSIRDMKEAEDLLWGAASQIDRECPSRVQVRVEMQSTGMESHPFSVVAGNLDQHTGQRRPKLQPNESVAPAYAAFPLQPENREIRQGGIGMTTKSVRQNVRFDLSLTFPAADQADVEAALWAWETFGGIGARTRRGFGALQVTHIDGTAIAPPADPDKVNKQLAANIGNADRVSTGTWPPDVPHLGPAVLYKITKPFNGPEAAWGELISKLKAFRQPGGYARSIWPEPDEVRRKTNQHLPAHAPTCSVHKFPRAAFGLPIIFHFKDASRGNPNSPNHDPRDTSLELAAHDRLASPLILRPLAVQGGKAVGLAAVLEGASDPVHLDLTLNTRQGAPRTWAGLKADLAAREAASITDANGNPHLGTHSDVVAAFLDTL